MEKTKVSHKTSKLKTGIIVWKVGRRIKNFYLFWEFCKPSEIPKVYEPLYNIVNIFHNTWFKSWSVETFSRDLKNLMYFIFNDFKIFLKSQGLWRISDFSKWLFRLIQFLLTYTMSQTLCSKNFFPIFEILKIFLQKKFETSSSRCVVWIFDSV